MMTSTPRPRHDVPETRHGQSLAILATLADTTWRIAVPTVGLALVGIGGDLKLGTKPWLTLVGTVIGFGIAALLVKRQLRDFS